MWAISVIWPGNAALLCLPVCTQTLSRALRMALRPLRTTTAAHRHHRELAASTKLAS